MEQNKPLGYLGGDIMTFGSNLARQYEYDKFKEANIPGSVYSPVMNKSINDKSNMTEEENNHLAEKICEADIERLWHSDYTVLCPEQSAIGTMCEMGVLYGWKYMAEHLWEDMIEEYFNRHPDAGLAWWMLPVEQQPEGFKVEMYDIFCTVLQRQANKKNYAHYFDIRTNHLNEKDWRRSFSINQMLYGMCLYATEDHELHNSFDEIIPLLKEQYGSEANESSSSN